MDARARLSHATADAKRPSNAARVTFVADSPTYGGAEGYVIHLLELLPVRFATTVAATEPVPRQLAAVARRRGRLQALPHVGQRWSLVPRLRRQLDATEADILHVNLIDPRSNRVVLAAAASARAPAVATVHMTGSLGAGLAKVALRAVYRRLEEVVAVSGQIQDVVTGGLRLPRAMTRVIRIGEPVRPISPPTNEGVRDPSVGPVISDEDAAELRVGAVGRLTAQKGFDLLIEATRRLVAEGHQFEVRVAGEGRDHARLVAAAEGLPVRFLGFVEDIPGFLADVDVFCLPSRAEGLPFALLEAMMAGLPCVTTRVGEIPAAVGDVVLTVPPGDVDALTGELRRLLGDEALRADLARRARQRAIAEFDVMRMVAEISGVYDSVLAGRRSSGATDR